MNFFQNVHSKNQTCAVFAWDKSHIVVCAGGPCEFFCVRLVESHDVGGCFVSVCACFPSTIRASLLTCAQNRHFWRRCTMFGALLNHAAAAHRAAKKKHSGPSSRVERDTVTNCKHFPLVPSARVKRYEIRAACGLENDKDDDCGMVKSVRFGVCSLACFVCVSCNVA